MVKIDFWVVLDVYDFDVDFGVLYWREVSEWWLLLRGDDRYVCGVWWFLEDGGLVYKVYCRV